MKRMPANEFKGRCLSVLESVCATGEPVLITKRGSPLAKLVPVEAKKQDFLGRLEGLVKIVGDVESPVWSG